MRSFLPFTLLPAVGCIANVELDADADADGLLASEEAALGSDPSNPDTDGDGWTDGEEAASYTSPISDADHPYEAGWKIDACRSDVESTGNGEGEVANNFEMIDQFSETVRLHDFCDQVVYIVFGAFW